jgi:hypothetical protein
MNITWTELDSIAGHIEAEGFGSVEREIREIADTANAAGVNAVLLAVLTDDRAPYAARARAFGMVAAATADRSRPAARTHQVHRSRDDDRPAVHA